MPRRTTHHRSSTVTRRKSNRTLYISGLLMLLFLLSLGCYALTGFDPLGIFKPNARTPTVPGPSATPPPAAQVTPSAESQASESWWQVYFTDPKNHGDKNHIAGSIEEKLIAQINNARESIHIAVYEFSLTPVAKALVAARQRGVEVEWVTDDQNGLGADQDKGHGQFQMLQKAGIQVVADGPKSSMHDKFIIFDRQIVWTGSTNLTESGIFKNNNNVLVIQSARLAQIYERQFQELWDGKFGTKKTSWVGDQSLIIENTPVQVYFSPEDHLMNHLIPLVQGAKKSIRLMAFSFTNDSLGDALLERMKAGVDVKGIIETQDSDSKDSLFSRFFCAGMAVRLDGNPSSYHHKVMVIDSQVVITGSANFTHSGDARNDENTLVITDPAIARLYLDEFKRTWAEAAAPGPGIIACPE